jgi:hypothetical protein
MTGIISASSEAIDLCGIVFALQIVIPVDATSHAREFKTSDEMNPSIMHGF